MSPIKVWEFTTEELEDHFDLAKTAVLQALVDEHVLPLAVAEHWARMHTVVISQKSIWRTLSNAWKKAPDTFVFHVVREIEPARVDAQEKTA